MIFQNISNQPILDFDYVVYVPIDALDAPWE